VSKRIVALMAMALFALAGVAASPAVDAAPRTTTYLLTLAARVCPRYTDVRANRARNNIMESLRDLGPGTNYAAGEALTVAKESAPPQSACQPLTGWRFTLGNAYSTGDPQNPSVVLGADATAIVTGADVPELDPNGNPTGDDLAGAVTISLTDEQVARAQNGGASPGGLWVMGGVPSDPFNGQRDTRGFAALRCAIDNLNGDNVEWVAFPEQTRHVFCFAYYVSPPPEAGTIVIRKELAPGARDDATFTFGGNVSYDPGGAFTLAVTDGQPASTTFIRGANRPGDPAWLVTESPTPGWQPAGAPTCTSDTGASTTTPTSGQVSIVLAEADTVTCTFTNRRFIEGLLQINKVTQGNVGGPFTFSIRLPNESPRTANATTLAEGVPVTAAEFDAPGTYTITETLPPAAAGGSWSLISAECNGNTAFPNGTTVTVTVSDTKTVCVFTNAFTPQGSIAFDKITRGGVGRFTYVVTPLDRRLGSTPLVVSATTTRPGVPVRATGDDLTGLPLGRYQVTEIPPPATVTGRWAATRLTCDSPNVAVRGPYQVTGTLTAQRPNVRCTVENTFDPPGTLQVVKRVAGTAGGRTSAVTIGAACASGDAATLTLAPSQPGPAQLATPLSFLARTTCTVREQASGVAPGGRVTTQYVVSINGRATAPVTGTSVTVTAAPNTNVVVTFTDTYTAPPVPPTTTTTATTPVVSPTLPATGGDPGNVVLAALALLLTGGALVVFATLVRRQVQG
jgi:hypothetical protein